MSRQFNFSVGEFYHLYSRGTDRREIFVDKNSFFRFQLLLFAANSVEPIHISNYEKDNRDKIFTLQRKNTLVDIGAYCLMPNHFHLIVHEKIEGGVSVFMQKLLTGYSMYFNKRYSRKGTLFEGRFKASHADDDVYLKYLFAYLHLNPVKLIDSHWKENGIKNKLEAEKFLKQYRYSSYLDYAGEARAESSILNKIAFPEYFQEPLDFVNSINDFINYSQEPL